MASGADSETGDSNNETSALKAMLADVRKSVETMAESVAFNTDPAVLGDVLCEAIAVKNSFDALLCTLVDTADRNGVPTLNGLNNCAQYLAAETNADPKPIRRMARLARWLYDFNQFEKAFAQGDMSESHLQLIRLKLDNADTHYDLIAAQHIFVHAAKHCGFDQFATICDYWLASVDPDGKEPQDQLDNTRLGLRKGRGGRLLITGECDAITGQKIQTAIDLETNKLHTQDAKNGVTRTETQRRLAALANLVERGAARADGTYSTPLINIVMSQTVAEWLLAWAADPDTAGPPPVHWADIDGRCELIDGTPIHPILALKTLGIATLRRTIIGANSRPVDVSVNARSFPDWMRTAIHIAARGKCETPGCDAPHHWLQTDHINPTSNGGPTRLDNAQNQCPPDNRTKRDQTGHTAWRNKPKHPPRTRQQPSNDDDDPDH